MSVRSFPRLTVSILIMQVLCVLLMGILFSGWVGVWSLPIGIASPAIGLLAALLSLYSALKLREYLYYPIAGLWLIFPLLDLGIGAPEDSGTAIITWNIGRPQDSGFSCALDALSDWSDAHPEGLLFLQEIPKNQSRQLEEHLDLTCIWKPYLSSCNSNRCNGLQICAPLDWSFSRTGHRDFKQRGTYGFLQTELNHTESGKTVNALNIHLESLWRTSSKLPDDSSPLTILHRNAIDQTEQVEQLLKIFSQLKDPILLIGDFNSPSNMWHHRALRQQLNDAHRSTGVGWGWTRFKAYLPLRIDFMYSSQHIEWTAPTQVRYDIHCSDHFPIESAFRWP